MSKSVKDKLKLNVNFECSWKVYNQMYDQVYCVSRDVIWFKVQQRVFIKLWSEIHE